MTKTTALAKIEDNTRSFISKVSKSLVKYAEREYEHGPFLRSLQQIIVNNPELAEFLENDETMQSLYNAARYAASTGLSLNPVQGKATLIVRNQKVKDEWVKVVTYQIMKDGMIDLAMETGEIKKIKVDTVRENDKFSIQNTSDGDEYLHQPARKNRGKIDGYFCSIKLKNGESDVQYMTSEEVKDHRERFSAKSSMPEEGYGLKTVLKKSLRNLSIGGTAKLGVRAEDSSEAEVIDVEFEQTGAEDLAQRLDAKPVKEARKEEVI